MSNPKNRFGFDSISDVKTADQPRRRGSGPMSSAVRETAKNLQESTEARTEQRLKNASDAKEYRKAELEGRLLESVPLDDIRVDDLPRDRIDLEGVIASDEMDELIASIRAHGQKEPIEVYEVDGALQLKKGWRRLNALRALFAETGDERFSTALARVDRSQEDPSAVRDRVKLYIDMVEENILRENLSFAEMAQAAIHAARDPAIEARDADEMVSRLYGSLHKMKRSYIRHFVRLLEAFGDDLRFPKELSRNKGADLSRWLKEGPARAAEVRQRLSKCATSEEQDAVVETILSGGKLNSGPDRSSRGEKEKFEFHIGGAKVTARRGEFRIKDGTDFTEVPRDRLEEAVSAFQRVLSGREPE